MPPKSVGLLVVLAAAGSLLGGPAAADWLVTIDGSAVETRGSWKVEGRLVVFHAADGVLTSMRLTEVDLAASEARTEAARRGAKTESRISPKAPAAPAKARFVLTDADVGHVEETPLAAPAEDGDAGATVSEEKDGQPVAPKDNPLQVASWEAVLGAGSSGVAVKGVLANPSPFFASGISVQVRVFDLEGEEIGSKTATLERSALSPGEQASLSVAFPDVFSVGDARFEITSFNAVVSDAEDDAEDDAKDAAKDGG